MLNEKTQQSITFAGVEKIFAGHIGIALPLQSFCRRQCYPSKAGRCFTLSK